MAKREFDLRIEEEAELNEIMQALSASIRRKMLCLLQSSSYSIAELAKLLKLPVSTVSFHVNILRKAGMINVTVKRNSRGNAKIISRQIDHLSIDFASASRGKQHMQYAEEIPLGSYTDARVIAPCGMASETGIILSDDLPGTFFSSQRKDAQMIWFSKGYLEYRIPNYVFKQKKVNAILLSMEICSEAPNYRNDWKSDITFWINGVEIATYTCPGDYGGRRGRLNPEWWSDNSTQYGVMKALKITNECVYLDETAVSTQTINKLGLLDNDYFTFRIGIKENSKNQGGVNIFGEKFGDFAQGLLYMVDFD